MRAGVARLRRFQRHFVFEAVVIHAVLKGQLYEIRFRMAKLAHNLRRLGWADKPSPLFDIADLLFRKP